MPVSRRLLLATLAAAPALARAQTGDPRLSERSIGQPGAPLTVTEYFSLTCSHCADFQKQTFPEVRAKLIDTGRIRYVWRDYPLDQLALIAAMIARALPAERYEPFITALLTSQERWAFNRNVNPADELAKLAALAGLSRTTFNATLADEAYKAAIMAGATEAETTLSVNSTPTFVMNGKLTKGAVGYAAFEKAVDEALA